jgi:hypothetical protein
VSTTFALASRYWMREARAASSRSRLAFSSVSAPGRVTPLAFAPCFAIWPLKVDSTLGSCCFARLERICERAAYCDSTADIAVRCSAVDGRRQMRIGARVVARGRTQAFYDGRRRQQLSARARPRSWVWCRWQGLEARSPRGGGYWRGRALPCPELASSGREYQEPNQGPYRCYRAALTRKGAGRATGSTGINV